MREPWATDRLRTREAIGELPERRARSARAATRRGIQRDPERYLRLWESTKEQISKRSKTRELHREPRVPTSLQ